MLLILPHWYTYCRYHAPKENLTKYWSRHVYSSNVRRSLLGVRYVELARTYFMKNFPQFSVFNCGPISEKENAESAESFINFLQLFPWCLLVKYWCLYTYNQCYYTVESLFHIFPCLTFAVLLLKWRIRVVAFFQSKSRS